MGKKGVLLDNGKSAQSSMALYWKKNREQSKNPKKQYEPTEEEQLDQRAQSGFQKWKIHKQKFISKAYEKKEKPAQTKKQTQKVQQQQEQFQMKDEKMKGPIQIPGFKSKQVLKHKLKPEHIKQVSQHDNILKLPAHMSDLTQDDIIRILRQKKAKSQISKQKKQKDQKEDVIQGEDFLESFRQNKKQKEPEQPEKPEEVAQPIVEVKEENFFKSEILNKLSKGDQSAISSAKDPQIANPPQQTVQPNVPQSTQIKVEPRRMIFKPRILNNRK